jgi:hypothetical protein
VNISHYIYTISYVLMKSFCIAISCNSSDVFNAEHGIELDIM